MTQENNITELPRQQPPAARASGRRVAADRQPKPFNPLRSTLDEQSYCADKPKVAKPALVLNRHISSYYVPVSFVAKDWGVTPRRIRHLLNDGRLEGRLQANGYWEVLYPYSYIFGTRGPSLKRQQRPKKPERSKE